MARTLIQAILPHSKPLKSEFERRNGAHFARPTFAPAFEVAQQVKRYLFAPNTVPGANFGKLYRRQYKNKIVQKLGEIVEAS